MECRADADGGHTHAEVARVMNEGKATVNGSESNLDGADKATLTCWVSVERLVKFEIAGSTSRKRVR